MLDIKFIRENPEKVKQGCQDKQVKVDIDQLLNLDKQKREMLQEIEQLRAEQNKLSRQGQGRDRDIPVPNMEKARELKSKIKELETKYQNIETEFKSLMSQIPNLPFDDVPVGKDETDNVVLRKEGKVPKFDFKAKDHLEIGENLDLIDVKRAAKVSGARFGYLKKEAVLLEFALINLAFDVLIKKGFVPVLPPVMIKPEMASGMGFVEQIDDEEAYYLPKDNLYLIGTSEQSIGTMCANEVFEEKNLPERYVGFSTCFRREAGSYGKDTRGILRVHQFDKIEMFSFCLPEKSKEEHKFLISLEEELMQSLKLPYRLVHLCTGDIAKPSASTFDIETWMPSQNKYRETHSCSNCTDFQARRLNIRYRNSKTNKLEFVHMLNGTAFAIPRMLIAILENYQQKNGTIKMPKVLRQYLPFKEIPLKK